MISKLEVAFSKNECEGISYQAGSLFQGAMMELVNPNYGEVLHQSELKPYSQNLFWSNDRLVWQINCLNSIAKSEIIDKIMLLSTVLIKKKNKILSITDKTLTTIDYPVFINESLTDNFGRHLLISFQTPTAFKTDGNYQFYPTVKHILQSAINKFDSFSSHSKIYDDEVFKQLLDSVKISSYDLKSRIFYIEKAKIPSFTGTLGLYISGPQQLVNLVWMIVMFAEYSGIGIKTAMGMGSIKVQRREINDRNRT